MNKKHMILAALAITVSFSAFAEEKKEAPAPKTDKSDTFVFYKGIKISELRERQAPLYVAPVDPDYSLSLGRSGDDEGGAYSLRGSIRLNAKPNNSFLMAPDGAVLSGRVDALQKDGEQNRLVDMRLTGRSAIADLNLPFSSRPLAPLSPMNSSNPRDEALFASDNAIDEYRVLHDEQMGIKLRASRFVGVEGKLKPFALFADINPDNKLETRLGLEAGVSLENNLKDFYLIAKGAVSQDYCTGKEESKNRLCVWPSMHAELGLLRAGYGLGMHAGYEHRSFDGNRSIAGHKIPRRIIRVTTGGAVDVEWNRANQANGKISYDVINAGVSVGQ